MVTVGEGLHFSAAGMVTAGELISRALGCIFPSYRVPAE